MKSFLQWVEERHPEAAKSIEENKVRTGIHTAMPKGYVRHEYPDAYFAPYTGTAYLDLDNLDKKVKDKAPPDNAP